METTRKSAKIDVPFGAQAEIMRIYEKEHGKSITQPTVRKALDGREDSLVALRCRKIASDLMKELKA